VAALAASGAAGRSNNNSPPAPGNYQSPIAHDQWVIAFSSAKVPKHLQQGAPVAFPGDRHGIHYVYRAASALAAGATISVTFTIAGAGRIVSLEGPPPPRVRLFLWRRGDNMSGRGAFQAYRYWSTAAVINERAGTYHLQSAIEPQQWIDVFGALGSSNQAGFAACVANLYAAGFTLGGMFAGHGQDVVDGQASFTLNDYSIR
jgi:hypothetical protein